jgi:acetolactate synthase-1/2/3 large subunit
MKVSDIVIKFIEEINVKHVFFLPGGGCMHIIDSLGKSKILKKICCLHEQAATIAAESYAQYTNNIGVAIVTSGPGSTNAITGVAGAWIDSTPIMVISGQVKRSDLTGNRGVRQFGVQEINITQIIKSITKYAITIMNPLEIKYHLQKAYYMATNGRKGPVWIDIPLDVQGAIVEECHLKKYFCALENKIQLHNSKMFQQKLLKTIHLLSKSKRPIILAGNGIRLSNSIKLFHALINKLNIPILLTWKASDLLWENHKLYCGKPGVIGQRGANFIQQTADFILCIGARLDLCQVGFNYSNFAPKAKKIIVDIDENEIKKLYPYYEIAFPVDAKFFIKEFLKIVNSSKLKNFSNWLLKCKKINEKYPVILNKYKKPFRKVNPYYLIDILSDVLKENDLIVPGSSGACAEITQQAFRLKKGQRIQNTPGLGSMGFGLPASIGACLASNKKRTISIIGDGGLQHNIQELETLARLKLPIKLFVLNNNGYGSIKNMQKLRFNGNYVGCDPKSGLTFPDTCKIAKAYGIKTTRIYSQFNLRKKILDVINNKGPIICDVVIDTSIQTAPKMSSQVLSDGRIISKPIEDLWPFLSREEFNKNIDFLLSE